MFDDDDEVRSRKWGCATFKYLTAEAQRRAQPQDGNEERQHSH